MTTLAGDLRTPDSTAVVEGTIALTATDQRTAGSKTLVTITYPIEVNASTYNETDIPAGEYEVQERLESDGMWGTESVYRVIVPESGTWSLRALREMYDGPPDPDPDLFLTVPVADATYAPLDQTLLGWAQAGSYQLITATRNAEGGLTGGTLLWPDGGTGTLTTTLSTADSSLNAVNAFVATHVLGGVTTTFTQPTMTRDSTTGAVTAQPALVVS